MHGYFTRCLKEGRGGVESKNYDDERRGNVVVLGGK